MGVGVMVVGSGAIVGMLLAPATRLTGWMDHTYTHKRTHVYVYIYTGRQHHDDPHGVPQAEPALAPGQGPSVSRCCRCGGRDRWGMGGWLVVGGPDRPYTSLAHAPLAYPHHRQNKAPEAKVMFQKIAKAYQVLMNETHRELYHRFMDHPDVRAYALVVWLACTQSVARTVKRPDPNRGSTLHPRPHPFNLQPTPQPLPRSTGWSTGTTSTASTRPRRTPSSRWCSSSWSSPSSAPWRSAPSTSTPAPSSSPRRSRAGASSRAGPRRWVG